MYDASSKTLGPTLNECLETGPYLLPKSFWRTCSVSFIKIWDSKIVMGR